MSEPKWKRVPTNRPQQNDSGPWRLTVINFAGQKFKASDYIDNLQLLKDQMSNIIGVLQNWLGYQDVEFKDRGLMATVFAHRKDGTRVQMYMIIIHNEDQWKKLEEAKNNILAIETAKRLQDGSS